MKLLRKEIARIRRHLKQPTPTGDDSDAAAAGKHTTDWPSTSTYRLCFFDIPKRFGDLLQSTRGPFRNCREI